MENQHTESRDYYYIIRSETLWKIHCVWATESELYRIEWEHKIERSFDLILFTYKMFDVGIDLTLLWQHPNEWNTLSMSISDEVATFHFVASKWMMAKWSGESFEFRPKKRCVRQYDDDLNAAEPKKDAHRVEHF